MDKRKNYKIKLGDIFHPAIGYGEYLSRNSESLDDSQHPDHKGATVRAVGLVAYHFIGLPMALGLGILGLEKLLG